MTNLIVAFADSNSAQQLTTTGNLYFRNMSVFAHKSFTNGMPTPNTNGIYVGFASGQLPIQITGGGSYTLELQSNQKESLSNIWIRGNTSDGAYIISH